ncbi:GNAT family N-acetyltransferase [Flavobacteriaceae bacterium TP-CH-4]|uniref:GNAT family N-acetyltransferase n=1 Tax=Pelagihabitans pacificus TaxID=2696054 RepID=A0A967AW89_9FLAO|nr:GNAT family N-acetyltransferase [Pelagihabitans pacificus]NHF61072.1 GNAT family N-acetyltransferase [Pelagihabitans pacificus]
MPIQIISDKTAWENVLNEIGAYDFYHTYDYHHISKKEFENPILITYKEKDIVIAIPFLKRPINDTDYFDLTSVYGYAGPISKNVPPDFDNQRFATEFKTALDGLAVVSVFSRLHPYFENQSNILGGLGNTPVLGKVVNIDLTQDLATQRAQYGKSTKNRTNKCRRVCTVRKAETDADINLFIDIYYENMDRLSASKDYYFTREYFFDFMKCDGFKTDILLVVHNETGEAMAASMFVKTKNIVQFHLSGTRTDYLYLAPANVFLDEMRIKATEAGYKIFNLGGGLGSKEDSLFDFKASFSKDYREFRVWKFVADQAIYDQLSGERKAEEGRAFFPLYRSPN